MSPACEFFYPLSHFLTFTLSYSPSHFPITQPAFQGVANDDDSYFCREYLEGNFLNDPVHAAFIDAEVLEKYYPVGGVRIEDDILVTEDGYENLTSAPKGEEMLRIINGE